MSNRPRPSGPVNRPPTRRQVVAQQREANIQRRAILAITGAVGLAALLLLAGFIYDRFYQPSVAIKQVNGVTLTRGEYEQLLRATTIQQMAQTLQFSKLFGSNQSFGQSGRFDDQIVQANGALAEIGTSRTRDLPEDETIVSQWVDRQLVEQGAKSQFQIEPSQGEIDQALVAELGSVIETTPAVTATDTLTGTDTLTATTEAATAAATSAATSLPTATSVPTATPEAAQATEQANLIIDELYTEYTNILGSLPQEALERQRTPNMTKEEMAQVMRTNYREQLLRTRVGEALVQNVPADDASTPQQITARHILLQVPRPEPTPEATAEADTTATAEEEATATAEPTPTPKPTVDELEQEFTERKAEADEIYEQLTANPDSFADLAREFSEDPGSKDQGGELPPFDRTGAIIGGEQGQGLVPEFTEAAWALQENQISEPVRSQFGWHIIQRLPEDPQAKLDRLRQTAFDTWLTEQRQQATIEPALTATPTEVPIVTTEEPLSETAAPEATTTP